MINTTNMQLLTSGKMTNLTIKDGGIINSTHYLLLVHYEVITVLSHPRNIIWKAYIKGYGTGLRPAILNE